MLAGPARAQATPPAAPASASVPAAGLIPGRPKICLVLSGGGARGAAHVGVLRVLQEMRVPVDCVTGTSMGSIVGAAYASGATIPEMEQMLAELSTRLLFRDLPPREERSVHLKRDDVTNLSSFEFGVGKEGVLLPKGLVSGVQLEAVLRELAKVRGYQVFDRLPIPYRAVATDLVTGKPFVIGEGELAAAMRASMSVPGAIEPVRLQGKLLVDGGLTNNLPVDVARAMGAEVVIAVNLGTPLMREEQLNSVLGVTGQMVNILTEQNVQASLASLKPTDILILPQLGDFSAGDFDHLPQTVPIGEAAARAVADQLAKYSVSPQAFAAWDARRGAVPPDAAVAVDEIRFENLRRVNPVVAQSVMETQPGQPIQQQVLDKDMRRLYGTGDFEHVSYKLLEEPGRRILSVDAVEKSWGPDYVRLGLGLTSDFSGDAFFNVLASHRRTWLNSLGGEWRNDVQFGRTNLLMTSFYQPLQAGGSGLFIEPRAAFERRTFDLFQADQRIATFDTHGPLVGVDLGAQFTRYGETRLGLFYRRITSSLDTGPPQFTPSPDTFTHAGLRWFTLVDQLDNVSFPQAGYAGSLEVIGASQEMGSDASFARVEASGIGAKTFGDHTFQLAFRLGERLGTHPLPPERMFQWGGFLQQSGYPTGALLGENLRFARLVYTNRLVRWSLLDGVYAGASLEVGRVGQPLLPNNEQGTLYSGALYIAVDTPLGPFYLGYGRASRGFHSFYLFLGKP
ncbi:patatin-like phospholipase PlpD [Ramlibacter solisilvae]